MYNNYILAYHFRTRIFYKDNLLADAHFTNIKQMLHATGRQTN